MYGAEIIDANFDIPRYVGLNEMVEELSLKMKLTRFQGDRINQTNIVERLAQTSEQYLAEVLGRQGINYTIWKEIAGPLGYGIQTVLVLGNTFTPNFVINVASKPTLALCIRHIVPSPMSSYNISSAIGEAVIYSYHYPAVIVFLYLSDVERDFMRLLDREMTMGLWQTHKVKLVIR